MNERDAFVREIIEHPDQTFLRSVFADWLEEQGDPRAEFIRVQCALAELSLDEDQREEYEAIVQSLLDLYAWDWGQPICQHVGNFRFSRGFVEHIVITARGFLEKSDFLFKHTPLQSIRFRHLGKHLPKLLATKKFSKLKSLDFSGNPIDQSTSGALFQDATISQLSSLNLSNTQLENRSVDLLATSPYLANLTSLELGGNALDLRVLKAIVESPTLVRLKHLGLSGTENQRPMEARYYRFGRYTSGESRAMRRLCHSSLLKQLTSLDLSKRTLGDNAAMTLIRSKNLGNVQELDLSHNDLHDEVAYEIARSEHFPNLVSLNLAGNEIQPPAEEALRTSNSLPNLKYLTLRTKTRRSSSRRNQ